jgi:hypothetical protein
MREVINKEEEVAFFVKYKKDFYQLKIDKKLSGSCCEMCCFDKIVDSCDDICFLCEAMSFCDETSGFYLRRHIKDSASTFDGY